MSNIPKLLVHLLLVLSCGALFPWSTSPMSCSYGPRGSLTAICVNATSDYFRMTNYRFDYLDETLVCLNCTLTTLDMGTFDIPGNEIKTLDIRNSSVSIIVPRAFLGMIYMQTLLLSNNNITRIYPGAFDGARKVKRLEMNNALAGFNFTGAFKGLHLLEELSLNHNSLEMIEVGMFEGLHSLNILDLSYNRLKTLRGIFDPLVNLKVLNLEHNSIRNLNSGNEFQTLGSLLSLNLQYNQMYNFSINLPDGNDLKSLQLAYNFLDNKSFQKKAFDGLNNLEYLDLKKNEFVDIPVRFFQGLYRLITMDLSYNKLKAISTGAFTGLPHLRHLNLSSNLVKDLKITGRFSLPSLVELDLARNHIVDFDYMSLIRRAPKLRLIDLRQNELSCRVAGELRVLFRNDAVSYQLDEPAPGGKACPAFAPSSADTLIAENVEEMGYRVAGGSFLIWMFVLLTVAILLIGLLFYVQFFNVLRIGPSRKFFPEVRLSTTRGNLQG